MLSAFIVRKNKIRIISARDMSRKERKIYEQRVVFPNLKPSTRTISIRLPESLFEHLKALATKKDMPYQSLLKILLAEKVEEELRAAK